MKIPCALLAALLVLTQPVRAGLPVTTLALEGDAAPDRVSDETYDSFSYASGSTNPANLTFLSFLLGSGVNSGTDTAGFAGLPAAMRMTSREGSPPDLSGSGVYLTFLASPSINASGTSLFYGNLSSVFDPVFGFYRRSSTGVLETFGETGDVVAGQTDLFLGSYFYGNRNSIDASGRGYFIAELSGSNVVPTNQVGVFRATPGNIELLYRQGTTVPPGAPNPINIVRFGVFSYLIANSSGELCFQSSITSSPAGADTGIWATDEGTLGLVALEGDGAPDVTDGTFAQFNGSIGLGDEGTIAFFARLIGTPINADNEWGLWKGKPGALTLLVREGQQAPGLDSGVVFSSFLTGIGETGPAVNPYGNVAFHARLRGTGITAANDDSIWVEDGNGVLQLVIREGDTIADRSAGTAGRSNTALSPFTFHSIGGFASTTRLIFTGETNAGTKWGVYAATVPDRPDTAAPAVSVRGPKRITTRRPTSRIAGTASDNIGVAFVEAKVGPSAYRRAAGTASWSFTARLKKGNNPILIRAQDAAGNLSPTQRVTVRRR